MKIRLGYVANALRFEDCSPSKTITLTMVNKIDGDKQKISRLRRIAQENLQNTLRILKGNIYDHIHVYRMTSKLIPLCTHPMFSTWDYIKDLMDEFMEIGKFIKTNNLRVSLHPDHFTLINSPRPDVKEASINDLMYHLKVLAAMELDRQAKLVIHVGGKYGDPRLSIKRFKESFNALPADIRERLVLENDDRCFSAREVLDLCGEISIPMVLDVHHHKILNNGEDLSMLLPEVFQTWGGERPKVHLSSPKSPKYPRFHADYIDANEAGEFLKISRTAGMEFDIMIEAKQKDLALFKLAGDLRNSGYNLPVPGEIILQ